MLNDKARKKLEKARDRAESKGNFDSAAHKILAKNPVKDKKRQQRRKENLNNGK